MGMKIKPIRWDLTNPPPKSGTIMLGELPVGDEQYLSSPLGGAESNVGGHRKKS